jgi:hypothetical protein
MLGRLKIGLSAGLIGGSVATAAVWSSGFGTLFMLAQLAWPPGRPPNLTTISPVE